MSSQDRTVRAITRELFSHPFFPILFIGEFVKQLVTLGVLLLAFEGELLMAAALVVAHGLLAVAVTVLWVLSDAVEVSIDAKKVTGD